MVNVKNKGTKVHNGIQHFKKTNPKPKTNAIIISYFSYLNFFFLKNILFFKNNININFKSNYYWTRSKSIN